MIKIPQRKITTQEEIEKMLTALDKAETGASDQKQKPKVRKIVKNLLFAALAVLLLSIFGSVITTKIRGGTPNVFGYYVFVVQTSSMEPTLKPGDVILSKTPKDASGLTAGTIVTFKTKSGQRVTHRIIDVVAQEDKVAYVTKGDNPINSPDADLLYPEQIEAVFVYKLPKMLRM